MQTTSLPQAREETRAVRVTLRRPALKFTGEGLEEREHRRVLSEGEVIELNREETIRTGYCDRHVDGRGNPLESHDFVGPNEHGWIFGCVGRGGAEPGHYFLNRAPWKG